MSKPLRSALFGTLLAFGTCGVAGAAVLSADTSLATATMIDSRSLDATYLASTTDLAIADEVPAAPTNSEFTEGTSTARLALSGPTAPIVNSTIDARCPVGSFDGANCFVYAVPTGLTGFVYNNNLYTSPYRNQCPIGWFDGANCATTMAPPAGYAAYAMGASVYWNSPYSTCSTGTFESYWTLGRARCRLGTAPSGSTGAFVWNNAFYYGALVSATPCPTGSSWDGANCFVKSPSSTTPGVSGFVYNRNLYFTAYNGPPIALWGGQTRPRKEFATIYIHGRNSSSAGGPINGFGYSGWNWQQKGPNPVWLSWNSSERLNLSMSAVAGNLDLACSGPDLPCHVVCHSAGCMMITRQLAENPGRWNIASVNALQGAQGGSEIADLGASLPSWIRSLVLYFGVMKNIDADLTTSAARNMYNHNLTSNVPVITASGEFSVEVRQCKWYQFACNVEAAFQSSCNSFLTSLFNGGNDAVLAYHSTAGFASKSGSGNACYGGSYWTNYTSILRRGGCYDGPNVNHLEPYRILQTVNVPM